MISLCVHYHVGMQCGTKGIDMCALPSVVHLYLFPHSHTNKAFFSAAPFGLPASRQALSLSGLCYRCGNSVALIKAVF